MIVQDNMKRLSEFAYELSFEALPDEIVETTKMFIADYFASAIAGFRVNTDFNNALLSAVDCNDIGEATLLFSRVRPSAENAAFLNAAYVHGADMDDGNKRAMGHIAAHTVSAVLALAETLKTTWGEVITAVNVGYEFFNRIAAAAQPGLLERGFHSTGMAGAIACSAACAKLMRLNASQICSAASIAAVQSSGLMIITESGQECKPLNPANAARVGILSAKLARAGVIGPRNALEHSKGWFHAVTDEQHLERLERGLENSYTITESYLKPYPSCRHTHCAIECALSSRNQMQEKYDAVVRHIQAVEVFVYPNAISVAGQISRPRNCNEAKFSISYAVAMAIKKGRFGIDELLHVDLECDTSDLIDKIHIIPDRSLENIDQGVRGARITVITDDNSRYEAEVKVPKGERPNVFTWEDIRHKFRDCSGKLISEAEQDRLITGIMNIVPADRFVPLQLCTRNGW